MVKVVVLGAHGRVAQIVEKFLFADKDVQTSLFLRNASRMADRRIKLRFLRVVQQILLNLKRQ